jgi:hypothetical protein
MPSAEGMKSLSLEDTSGSFLSPQLYIVRLTAYAAATYGAFRSRTQRVAGRKRVPIWQNIVILYQGLKKLYLDAHLQRVLTDIKEWQSRFVWFEEK